MSHRTTVWFLVIFVCGVFGELFFGRLLTVIVGAIGIPVAITCAILDSRPQSGNLRL